MWTAKLILPSDKTHLLASRTKKYNINLIGYPISHYTKSKKLFVTIAGTINGSEQNKKHFLRDIKHDCRVKNIELHNDFIITQIQQPYEVHVLYDPSIFHIKPILVDNNGFYHWEIASWTKEKLLPVYSLTKKYHGKLMFIHKQKLKNINYTTIFPILSKQQGQAIELAIARGYYESPRKITLKQLAKIMGISYSTYQYHLQLAEKKLLPILFKRI